MKNNLNLLIVGCGQIASLHARILKEQFSQHKIYCIDKNIDSQNKFIRKFNAKEFDKNIHYDALLICTPTNKHLDTLKKYKNYATHYFIEKPLVNTKKEYDELLTLVSAKNLYCGFIEIHNELFIELKNLLGNEKLISIQIVRHSPEIISERLTSHAHMDLAIHDLSVLFKHFINYNNLEKFEIIKNFKIKNYYETAEILLKDKDININISVSRKTNKKIRTWRVVSNLKTYEVDIISNTITVYDSVGSIQIDGSKFTQKTTETLNNYSHTEPAEIQMKDFINGVLNQGFKQDTIEIIKNSHLLLLDD
tara:strand:- start:837 stop:1760 length:924 start_codon:yes stop_codon:yes gene_type:complete